MNMEKRTVSKKRRRKKNEKNTRVHTNLCCYGNFTFQILSLTLRFLYVNGAFVQRIHKFIVWQCVLFLSFFYCRSTDKYKTFWQSPQVQHTHILSIQGSKKTTKHHILFRNFENWLFSQFITDFDIELLWKFHAFIVYNNYMSSIHVKIVHRCLHIFDIHLRFGRISIVFPFITFIQIPLPFWPIHLIYNHDKPISVWPNVLHCVATHLLSLTISICTEIQSTPDMCLLFKKKYRMIETTLEIYFIFIVIVFLNAKISERIYFMAKEKCLK